ncbi:MAG TPA: site-2 protease family protein [Patescibacteria group bacterium]
MLSSIFADPTRIIITIVSLIAAVTVHEFAHAFMANYLGDPTPRLQGRLTLNPLAHLDPLGSLVFIITSFFQFPFGWGKPVQFDPFNLQNPKRDAALISVAGPISNIIFASTLSLILRFTFDPFSPYSQVFVLIRALIELNVVLAVFNLVPIHPLDGGKILVGLLPTGEARAVDRFLSQYGLFVLLILIFPLFGGVPLISIIISPVVQFLLSVFIPGARFI